MKKIKLVALIIFCVILTACGETEEQTIEDSIVNRVNYINENNISVYFNSNSSIDLNEISSLQNYDSLEDVELTEPYTFIGFDVEEQEPTDNDISIIQDYVSQRDTDDKVSICFFGTKDFDYLEPLLSSEGQAFDYQNASTIAKCFGNFRSSQVDYSLSIIGFNFEDIVKDELQYKDAILNYIQEQYDTYVEKT